MKLLFRQSGRKTQCESRQLLTGKNADVSCGRLHRDVMDGARLFPQTRPRKWCFMPFQSAALNYSVELVASAHSWEASAAVSLLYPHSEFD